jgi:hypothetical protein
VINVHGLRRCGINEGCEDGRLGSVIKPKVDECVEECEETEEVVNEAFNFRDLSGVGLPFELTPILISP